MSKRILTKTAIAVCAAVMSCMTFADGKSITEAECNASKATVINQLVKAHSEGKFMNISYSNDDKNVFNCTASFVYDVDDEQEVAGLHAEFIKYLDANTTVGFPDGYKTIKI
ncbi:hypothetical protein SOX05_08670 [Pseudomonas putida]|nr:hypothetical protein [Pseudomonas putida]MDY4319334.1 hypothetical protein [Pseudomonas putida]MDY4352719.1 hypothetical protein [Pseudomonas putida]